MHLKPYEAGELASQHARRVRNVLSLCSVIMVGAGLGWGVHFALTGHHELVLLDIAIVLIGLTIGFLARGGQNRAASAVLIAAMWFVLGLLSVFQDIPSAAAPRSVVNGKWRVCRGSRDQLVAVLRFGQQQLGHANRSGVAG